MRVLLVIDLYAELHNGVYSYDFCSGSGVCVEIKFYMVSTCAVVISSV
jgi:Pyruvate/2-oxoacid:ferredoxin oxidoreductase delta subunit